MKKSLAKIVMTQKELLFCFIKDLKPYGWSVKKELVNNKIVYSLF